MKIFQIGFNKCGTNSICNLFKFYANKKLNCVHWDEGKIAKTIRHNIVNNTTNILGEYDKYDVITDMEHSSINEIILIYTEHFIDLDNHYPNSKFILNIRSIDNWIISRLNHEIFDQHPYLDKYKKVFNLRDTNEVIDYWKNSWYNHIDKVKRHFHNKPNQLLVFDIEKDNFTKFADFFLTEKIVFSIDHLPKHNITANKPKYRGCHNKNTTVQKYISDFKLNNEC